MEYTYSLHYILEYIRVDYIFRAITFTQVITFSAGCKSKYLHKREDGIASLRCISQRQRTMMTKCCTQSIDKEIKYILTDTCEIL